MPPFTHYPGTGPPIHLAHANAYPPGCYRALLETLAPDFDVWAVDHRPLWPGSAPEAIDSWEPIAEDMVRFLDKQGLKGIVGVGHSLGAVVTMMAAVARPELFRVLVLVEPVFFVPEFLAAMEANRRKLQPEDVPAIRTALRRRAWWPNREAAFARLRPKRVFARLPDEALWDYVAAGTEPAPEGGIRLRYPREWEARIYGLPPTEVWDLLPQVRQPTLAIRGAESETLSPAAWQLWQRLQPGATFLEILAADHLAPLSHPVMISEAIKMFERSNV